MAVKLLVLLLPALVYAKIDVQVTGTFDDDNSDLDLRYFGEDVAIISDQEINTFQLSDNNLNNAVRDYFGKRPDDAYLKSPTPWNDLYVTYGWKQVTRTLRPRSGRILGIKSQPVIVMQQLFENNSTVEAKFNVAISQTVANTVTSSWNKGGELTTGQEIEYGFNIEVINVGGKTSFEYSSSWGENYQKSETITVGSTSALEVVLQPGKAVIAQLQATRGTVQVEVDYEGSLDGVTAVNYSDGYNGHHFWGPNIRGVMSSGGLSNDIPSKELIDIGFYTTSRVTVRDRDTRAKLFTFDC